MLHFRGPGHLASALHDEQQVRAILDVLVVQLRAAAPRVRNDSSADKTKHLFFIRWICKRKLAIILQSRLSGEKYLHIKKNPYLCIPLVPGPGG